MAYSTCHNVCRVHWCYILLNIFLFNGIRIVNFMHAVFFMYSSVDELVCCFCMLAVVDPATVNMGILTCLWDPCFHCFGWIFKSEIPGSFGNPIFNSGGVTLCPVFHNNRTVLHVHNSSSFPAEAPVSLHHPQYLSFEFFIMTILISHYGFDLHLPDD